MPGPMGYGGMAGMPSYYRPPPPSSNGIQSRDICYRSDKNGDIVIGQWFRRCGQPGHRARECSMPEGQFKCFQCGQDGHMARVCAFPWYCSADAIIGLPQCAPCPTSASSAFNASGISLSILRPTVLWIPLRTHNVVWRNPVSVFWY